MLKGVDISHFQSSIPSGGDFVILKATEGMGNVDGTFASRWKTLGERGMLRGAYDFGHPAGDPVAEADHFLSVVRSAGLRSGDVLVLDHEVSDGTTAAHCAAWARAWCAHVQSEVGWKPVVYTFLSFAAEGRCAGLGGYPLWIADPSRPAGQPRVPDPWKTWTLHQYSEVGGVDHDVLNGTRTDWLALGGQPTQPVTQEEDEDMSQQLADGPGAITPLSFKDGCRTLRLIADNGLQGLPPAQVRVAVRYSDHWKIERVAVDSGKGATSISLQPGAFGASVQRTDNGAVHVSAIAF